MTDLNQAFKMLKPNSYKDIAISHGLIKDTNNDKFVVIPIKTCWKCKTKDYMMTTNDGNKTQICTICNTKIVINGDMTY